MTDIEPRTAFTEADIERWLFDISRHPPNPMGDPNRPGIATTRSFGLRGVRTGLVVKFAQSDGTEIELKLNPAIAHHLRLTIMEAGQKMGWMQPNGTISFPVLED